MKTLNPSDRVAVLDAINPGAQAGTVTGAWLKLDNFQSIMAILMAGTLGGVVDMKIEQAKDDAGTDVKDVADKLITQLVNGADDDKQAIIDCWAHDLDLENSFTHVRVSATFGAAGDAAVAVMGLDARYHPASNYDAASVAEVVA